MAICFLSSHASFRGYDKSYPPGCVPGNGRSAYNSFQQRSLTRPLRAVCVKIKALDAGIPVRYAEMKLRSEFGFSGDFAPDDGTDPMLAEADDSIRDGMAFWHRTWPVVARRVPGSSQTVVAAVVSGSCLLQVIRDDGDVPPDNLTACGCTSGFPCCPSGVSC